MQHEEAARHDLPTEQTPSGDTMVEPPSRSELVQEAERLRAENQDLSRRLQASEAHVRHLLYDPLTGMKTRGVFELELPPLVWEMLGVRAAKRMASHQRVSARDLTPAERGTLPLWLFVFQIAYLPFWDGWSDVEGGMGDQITKLFADLLREHTPKPDDLYRLRRDRIALLTHGNDHDLEPTVLRTLEAFQAHTFLHFPLTPKANLGHCRIWEAIDVYEQYCDWRPHDAPRHESGRLEKITQFLRLVTRLRLERSVRKSRILLCANILERDEQTFESVIRYLRDGLETIASYNRLKRLASAPKERKHDLLEEILRESETTMLLSIEKEIDRFGCLDGNEAAMEKMALSFVLGLPPFHR